MAPVAKSWLESRVKSRWERAEGRHRLGSPVYVLAILVVRLLIRFMLDYLIPISDLFAALFQRVISNSVPIHQLNSSLVPVSSTPAEL